MAVVLKKFTLAHKNAGIGDAVSENVVDAEMRT